MQFHSVMLRWNQWHLSIKSVLIYHRRKEKKTQINNNVRRREIRQKREIREHVFALFSLFLSLTFGLEDPSKQSAERDLCNTTLILASPSPSNRIKYSRSDTTRLSIESRILTGFLLPCHCFVFSTCSHFHRQSEMSDGSWTTLWFSRSHLLCNIGIQSMYE